MLIKPKKYRDCNKLK